MQRNRLESIITLRAIAALLVCFIHAGMIAGFHTNGPIQLIINEGQQGVPIFFVISGFILPYSLYKKGYLLKHFWWFLAGRVIRIDPPYWASIILVFLLGLQPLAVITVKSIFLHLTYLVPFVKHADWFNDVYWTLSIEFQYYILIGLAYPFLMRLKPVFTLVAVIIPPIVCILLKANARGIIVTNLYDFTIGFIVFLGFIKKIDAKYTILALLAFSGYVMFAVSIKSGLTPLIAALIILYYRNALSFKPVLSIGNISYSLYLIHIPVSTLVVRIAGQYVTASGYLFLLSIGFSLFAAFLFYIAIEKPAIRYSHKIRYRLQNKADNLVAAAHD